MLNARLQELLETIPNLTATTTSNTSLSPIGSLECWLGLTDGDGPSIEDDDDDNLNAFFENFSSLLIWAYQVPFHPMEDPSDFSQLEAVLVTKWLRHCLELHVSGGSFAQVLLSSSSKDEASQSLLVIQALYHHVNQLSQLHSVQTIYIQSLRKTIGSTGILASRLEELTKIETMSQVLQQELDDHLNRCGIILGDVYAASSMELRSLSRQLLATYWHSFVSRCSGSSSVALLENNRASGLAMTLRVLLRIVQGIPTTTKLQPSHRHLLFHSLIPLHQPNSLVLWRDQTALLDLYHEPLVQCMAILLQKEPDYISPTLEALLTDVQIWNSSNTPKMVLLLHEVDTFLTLVPNDEDCQLLSSDCWNALLTKLTSCMASDNSRLAERALQLFRNATFKRLFSNTTESSLPRLLQAVVKAELPWNPTVRKMTYNILKDLRDEDPAAFGQACRCQVVTSGGSSKSAVIPKKKNASQRTTTGKLKQPQQGTSTESSLSSIIPKPPTTGKPKQQGTSTASLPSSVIPKPPTANKRASKPPDFSLKTGMGDWRPPKRSSRMPPPGMRTTRLPPSSIGRGTAPWASGDSSSSTWKKNGSNPPLTVTGVAPWAMKNNKAAPPPLTVTGVAPWAMQSNDSAGNQTKQVVPSAVVEEEEEQLDEPMVGESLVETENPALARVLKYMEELKPPEEEEGVSHWSKTQMQESPTLLPSLKFHDLVFGHELGTGAFGSVKYARQIDQSKTRSHWSEYAVKIISTQKILEMGYESSVQREIATLRVLSHPGIARLISSFRFRDGAYLVLEYASQGDLHGLLRQKGSLDMESTRFVMGEVVAALASIHALGFLYGDLKTENTVITETGHIKLTDFGACRPCTNEAKELIRSSAKNLLQGLRDGDWKSSKKKKEEEMTDDDVVVGWCGNDGKEDEDEEEEPCEKELEEDLRVEGTTAYLPPEVVLGAVPTPAADAWALGCVIYQCLTGRPPLLEDDDDATRQKIVSFHHQQDSNNNRDVLFGETYAKDVPAEAKSLIRNLLSRQERPTMSQVADDAFFQGVDVYTLYRGLAHPLDVGTVAPVADAKWGRRQLSSIWAPQPKAYDISVASHDQTTTTSSSAPIPEGDEASSFFSFSHTRSSAPLYHVNEHQEH